MKKIAFLSNFLSIRGTEVALYDYANYNETILNNKSIIITRAYERVKQSVDAHTCVYDKFENRFAVFYYRTRDDIEKILEAQHCDILYVIKSGENDGLYSEKRKTIIHCVFAMDQPHGDVYIGISNYVARIYGKNMYKVLPHIVNLPQTSVNLRHQLNIPEKSLVFGRYGGYTTFDIKFVHEVVEEFASQNENIYFLFMNTENFCKENHKNIIFLDATTDLIEKVKFINTCDALLHARQDGETFGLACGEFALKDKIVITYGKSKDYAHLDIMKNDCLVYNNYDELMDILVNFDTKKIGINVQNNGYKKFTPEYVMDIFRNVINIIIS